MTTPRSISMCLILFWSQLAVAATVLKVAPTAFVVALDAGDEPLTVGQRVCAERAGKMVACGQIAKQAGNKAAIKILRVAKNAPLLKGDNVVLQKPGRKPASKAGVSSLSHRPAWESDFVVSLGGSGGLDYIYPQLHGEYVLGSGFSVGLMPLFWYQTGLDSQAVGFGGFVTGSYFFGRNWGEGLGLVVGAGMYSLGLAFEDLSENATALAGFGQVQYRHRFGRSSWSVGLNLGAQFVMVDTTLIAISFSGLVPMGSLYVSYRL